MGTIVRKAFSVSLTVIPCLCKPDISFRPPSNFLFPEEYLQLPNHSILESINSQAIPDSGRQVGPNSWVLQGNSSLTCLQKRLLPPFYCTWQNSNIWHLNPLKKKKNISNMWTKRKGSIFPQGSKSLIQLSWAVQLLEVVCPWLWRAGQHTLWPLDCICSCFDSLWPKTSLCRKREDRRSSL